MKDIEKMAETRRVALLTNFLPHYRLPLLEALIPRIGSLRIYLSAKMEQDRNWQVVWGSLDVVLQKSFTFTHYFRNVHGYLDWSNIHVPYDTIAQLRIYKPDVVISGELGLRTAMSALYRVAYPKTKLILWATLSDHTEATRGLLRRMLRRWIIRRVDAALVNGKSGARYLAGLGFSGPVFTIPYVIDNDAFAGEQSVPDDGVCRLLYTGQLIERKGTYRFLNQLCQWCRNNLDRSVSLRIVGDGSERARLESASLPPNLAMELVGEVYPSELPGNYHSASIFVFPTLGDEWGTVVNEALSAGLPVLGSIYSQAVEELITEGKSGWKFDPSDSNDTLAALDRALRSDREMLQAMSCNARVAIAGVTPAIIAERMARAVESVARA